MDNDECQPLYLEILEFYEGLNMKMGRQIPMLLAERQALNEAMEVEKNVGVNVFYIHLQIVVTSVHLCFPNLEFLFAIHY